MLVDTIEIAVKFNEADPLGIVWHGHYIRYFEDGREAFGKKYGLSYLELYNEGLVVPLVSVDCQYKSPLRYGESVLVETTYHTSQASKLNFKYRILVPSTGKVVATGASVQVFVDSKSFDLHLITPKFYERWKAKWNF